MSEAAHIPQLRFPEYSANWSQRLLSDFLIPTLREIEKPKVNYLAIGLRSHCKGTFQKPDSDPSKIAMEKLFRVKENDLIVNITFAWEGAIAIVKENDEGGLVSHRFPTYTFDTNITSHHFFKHQFINKRFRYLLDLISPGGAGRNRVMSKKEFVKLKVPLPSVGEQQKIAAFLTAVDKKIEQLSKKQELLGEYKKGAMQQIFSQAIRFKANDGGDYPDWEELKLGEVARFRRGSFPQPYGNPEWYDDEDGKPFVQVYDVAGNMRLKSTTKRKISVLAQSSSVFVPKGNVVLTIQGSIGRIALTQYDAYVDRTLLIFTGYIKEVNKQFFIYVIYLLFEIEKIKAPGGTIKTITKEALTSFKLDLPCFDEQTKIANFLSSIDSKIEQVGKQLDKSKQFKKALLQQMFV